MIRISKLEVTKFRNFTPGSVYNIGPCITLIAGINGTSKSTLLGMIAQPLGFPVVKKQSNSAYIRAYDSIELKDYKTLADRPFKTSYSEVFRISQKYDQRRGHEYTLYLEGDSIEENSGININGLNVRSEGRDDQDDNKLRFVTNSTNRNPGWGNFPHPVIYLGLDRLRPLSTLAKKDIISTIERSVEEEKILADIYRVVMIVGGNEKVTPESVDTGKDFKKSYLSVETTYFDAESASAGQDNLGQIITAVISFHRLKKQLGDLYQGGLLLIDELDATLHPIAQELLLKKLIDYAKSLSLQIVATTHSLSLIKKALHDYKADVSLLYLKRRNQKIEPHNDANMDFILSDLACVRKQAKLKDIPKTTILFEDGIAAGFFEQVTAGIFKPYIQTYNTLDKNQETSLSNGVLKNIAVHLATKKIPEFAKLLFILDPDSKNLLSKKAKNLLALPGDFYIEKLMNHFLLNNSSCEDIWNYLDISFEECMAGYNNIEDDPNNHSEQDKKKKYKEWFMEQLSNNSFGKNAAKLFKIWAIFNKSECFRFCNMLLKALLEIGSPFVVAQHKHILGKITDKFYEANDLGLNIPQ